MTVPGPFPAVVRASVRLDGGTGETVVLVSSPAEAQASSLAISEGPGEVLSVSIEGARSPSVRDARLRRRVVTSSGPGTVIRVDDVRCRVTVRLDSGRVRWFPPPQVAVTGSATVVLPASARRLPSSAARLLPLLPSDGSWLPAAALVETAPMSARTVERSLGRLTGLGLVEWRGQDRHVRVLYDVRPVTAITTADKYVKCWRPTDSTSTI